MWTRTKYDTKIRCCASRWIDVERTRLRLASRLGTPPDANCSTMMMWSFWRASNRVPRAGLQKKKRDLPSRRPFRRFATVAGSTRTSQIVVVLFVSLLEAYLRYMEQAGWLANKPPPKPSLSAELPDYMKPLATLGLAWIWGRLS